MHKLTHKGAAIATENIRINTLIVDVPLDFIHIMAQVLLGLLNSPKTNTSVLLLDRL
jgi:hypothetical protein